MQNGFVRFRVCPLLMRFIDNARWLPELAVPHELRERWQSFQIELIGVTQYNVLSLVPQ